jgi:tetratricopeptide (TPR) repeat protein
MLLVLFAGMTLAGPAAQEIDPQQSAVRSTIDRLLDAAAAPDFDEWIALWSPRAPELDMHRQTMPRRMEYEQWAFLERTFGPVVVDGDRARARVTLLTEVTIPRIRRVSTMMLRRTYELKLEDGTWRVWRERATADEIADAIAAAPQSAWARLVEREGEYVTAETVAAMVQRGFVLSLRGATAEALALNAFTYDVAVAREAYSAGSTAAYNAGNLLYANARYEEAQAWYEKSLAMAGRGDDRDAMASAWLGIGLAGYSRADYARALDAFERRLALLREAGDPDGAAATLVNLGDVLFAQGHFTEALSRYRSAVADPALRDRESDLARAFEGLGRTQAALDDLRGALASNRRALVLYEKTADQAAQARVLCAAGGVHFRLGQQAPALDRFLACLAKERALQDREGIASALINVALLHVTARRLTQAIEAYAESLQHYDAVGNAAGAGTALLGLGLAHAGRRDFTRSLAHYQLALDRFSAAGLSDGIARAHLGRALARIAERQAELALDESRKAAAIAAAVGNTETVAQARLAEGRAERLLSRTADARRLLEQAAALVESDYRLPVIGDRTPETAPDEIAAPFDELALLLAEAGDAAGALAMAERARAARLAELLRPIRLSLVDGMDGDLVERERSLARDLAAAQLQLGRQRYRSGVSASALEQFVTRREAARKAYQDFAESLFERHPGLRIRRGLASVDAIVERLAATLEPGEVVIAFAVQDDATLAWAASLGEGRRVRLELSRIEVSSDELADRVARYRAAVVAHAQPAGEPPPDLHRLLLAPFEPLIVSAARLIVVPDGPLWSLPFAALTQPGGRYLVEIAPISYALSIDAFARARAAPLAQGEGTAVVTSAGTVASLEPTYETRAASFQVKTEAELISAATRRVAVQIGLPTGIDDGGSLFAGVALPAGEGDDQVMTAARIAGLSLETPLVIFDNAKWTHQPALEGRGAGAMGWALLLAGCPTAIWSDWTPAGPELTAVLHRRLAAGDRPSAALQAAMIDRIRGGTAAPADWAGVVLYGADRVPPVEAGGAGATRPLR